MIDDLYFIHDLTNDINLFLMLIREVWDQSFRRETVPGDGDFGTTSVSSKAEDEVETVTPR